MKILVALAEPASVLSDGLRPVAVLLLTVACAVTAAQMCPRRPSPVCCIFPCIRKMLEESALLFPVRLQRWLIFAEAGFLVSLEPLLLSGGAVL